MGNRMTQESSIPQLQLILHQPVIQSFPFRQFLVRTFFRHLSFVQYHYFIGILYRTQPMSYHYYRFPPIKFVQMLHDFLFVIGIQCVCCLVEEEELRILIHRPCYQQPLSLPLTDAVSLHADFCIVAQRQRVDKLPDVRHRHGMTQPLDVYLVGVHGNVVRDGIREDETVLHHRPALRPPQVRIDKTDGRIPHADVPLVRFIESQYQFQ